jgi:hypothetical protein
MSAEFPFNSRYYGSEVRSITMPDGRVHVYLERRFLPASERLQVIALHTVKTHERLDHIAFQHFADPILFWRICDANDAMQPEALLEPLSDQPRRLRITLPEGVTGSTS